MIAEKEYYKISSKTTIANQEVIQDLKATSPNTIGADNPNSNDQKPLKWEKEEQDGLIRIKSVEFADHYLGAVSDGTTCNAVLGKEYNNSWFEIVEDATTNEFFISIIKESLTCYDSAGPKYLTIGEPNRGGIPIIFETEKPVARRSTQKWKFTRVSKNDTLGST